jgi:hypothetical protein
MIFQYLVQLARRRPAETTIGGQAEVGQELSRNRQPLVEGRHAVDNADVNTRPVRIELGKRGIERVIGAIERGDVNPVHAASGCSDRGIGQINGAAQVVWRKPRPATERAKTEMESKRYVGWNFLGQTINRRHVGCDLALGAITLTVDGRDLPGAVPLDCQILKWNRIEDGVEFSRDGRLGTGNVIGRTTLLTIGMEIWNRIPAGNTPCSRRVFKTKWEFTASLA